MKFNESEIAKMVSEATMKILKEFKMPVQPSTDYEGNDLSEESIIEQAVSAIYKMEQNGEAITWEAVAKNMGFRLETLNEADMELLHDAIEHAMALPGVEDDLNESMSFEKKDGKYYVYTNGVRHLVSKETYEKAQEDERQDKIQKMNQRDKEDREKRNKKDWFNESQLRKVVAESVKRVLKEGYEGNYTQLIKEEMHRLYELEQKVPNRLKSEIHSMVISMQAMLEEAQRNDEFDNWNN